MKKIELKPGDKYSYWTIISISDFTNKKGDTYYNCECQCGTVRDVISRHLRNGKSKSCGCFVKETMAKLKRIGIGYIIFIY